MVFTDEEVEAIYLEYPRKRSKPIALKAIRAALGRLVARNGRKDIPGWLRARTMAYAAFRKNEKRLGNDPDLRWTPYPANWFNANGFDEEIPEVIDVPLPVVSQRDERQERLERIRIAEDERRRGEREAFQRSQDEVREFEEWWVPLGDTEKAEFVRRVESEDAHLMKFWTGRDPLTSRTFRSSCVVLWNRTVRQRNQGLRLVDESRREELF